MNSRAKGKRGELEAVAALRAAFGLPDVQRGARNGVPGAADIVGIPGVHVEVKRRRSISVMGFMHQAREDAPPGDIPCVLMRMDHEPWMVMVSVEQLHALVQCLSAARTLPQVRE